MIVNDYKIVGDFTRLIVGIMVDFSIPASRVLLVIEKSIALYSRPRIFRTDNGSEFIEGRLNRFLSNARIRHEFIEKGKPQQNGFSESFNARFEDECLRMLDLNLMPLKEIKQAIYDWIKEYNCQRPHSSIAYETPIRFHILPFTCWAGIISCRFLQFSYISFGVVTSPGLLLLAYNILMR